VRSERPSPPLVSISRPVSTQDEILDLVAYALSGGERQHAMFK
jgi:hypothetical protein